MSLEKYSPDEQNETGSKHPYRDAVDHAEFLRNDEKANLYEIRPALIPEQKSAIIDFIKDNEADLKKSEQEVNKEKTIKTLEKIAKENPEVIPEIDRKVHDINHEILVDSELESNEAELKELASLESDMDSLFS